MEPFFKIFGQFGVGIVVRDELGMFVEGLNPLDVILEDVGIEASSSVLLVEGRIK